MTAPRDVKADDKATAVTLLRRLAGRVPDGPLNVFRGYLAASEWDLLANSLSGYLAQERIALDETERRMLDEVAGPGAAAGLPELDGPPPAYRFSAEGPEPAAAERSLAGRVSSLRSARRLAAAYRRPAGETALPLTTWVYLLEVAPGTDVAFLHSQLAMGYPDRGVVEVYAAGEKLPPYQADALAVARLIWSHSPE